MSPVCEKCLNGTPYVTFAHDNGTQAQCAYCGCTDPSVNAICFDTLLSYLQERVHEYLQEDVGEFNDDEGNPVVQTYDSYDIAEFLGVANLENGLCEDIQEAFEDSVWIREDPMAPPPGAIQSSGWTRFKEAVKHSHRYTFWRSPEIEIDWRDSEHMEVAQVPGMLLDVVADCVEIIPKNTEIYRVQVVGKNEPLPPLPARFTSPPKEKAAQPNRMSPAGVPMFYGAANFNTALQETVALGLLGNDWVYGLKFETVEEMAVLDLTKGFRGRHLKAKTKTEVRSFPFYEDEGFLKEFARDVSIPIVHDGRQHIDYIPTQVFTEYVRYLMKTEDGEPIQGIKYTSSKTGKPCFVIFATQAQCLDSDTLPKDGPQLLRPIPGTLKHWELALEECK